MRRTTLVGMIAALAAAIAACGTARPIAAPRGEEPPAVWPPEPAAGRVEPERLEVAPGPPEWTAGLQALPWVVRDDPERPEDRLAIFWNPACEDEDGSAGWSFAVGAAEIAWESLECVDAMAVADIEGDGTVDVAAAAWEEACPDPVAPGGSASPCLLLSVWPDGNGIPRAYRLEASGDGVVATGVETIDRIAALLAAPPCPALDLRSWSAERVGGLVSPGDAGERIDGIRCVPHPFREGPAVVPAVALLHRDAPGRIPSASFVLRAEAGDAWADGYEPLADVDGDGVRDWLWIDRDDSGDRMTVARGPGRGPALATFSTDAGGNLLDRRVVAPPGGRAALASWEVVAATAEASAHVRLEVSIERPAGDPGAVSLDVPLGSANSPPQH